MVILAMRYAIETSGLMVITTFIDLTRTTMVYRLAYIKKSGNRLSRCPDFVIHFIIRYAIKKRKVFPTDESVKKVMWLAIQSASQKWTMPLQDWRIAMSRFIIEFGDRLDGHF